VQQPVRLVLQALRTHELIESEWFDADERHLIKAYAQLLCPKST
jgi:hypothetical protein